MIRILIGHFFFLPESVVAWRNHILLPFELHILIAFTNTNLFNFHDFLFVTIKSYNNFLNNFKML